MFIDTHCHLDYNEYDDLDKVIDKMKDNIIIVSGVDYNTNKVVLDLCAKYTNVYGTMGLHPEYFNISPKELEKTIAGIWQTKEHFKPVPVFSNVEFV